MNSHSVLAIVNPTWVCAEVLDKPSWC